MSDIKFTDSIDERNILIIDRIESFIGGRLYPDRNVIQGYPVDVIDSDGPHIQMIAVDADVTPGIISIFKKAGFKVKQYSKVGILVS